MFSLVEIGNALNRKSQIYNTIAVSAFFIILLNPNIIFDVGFQLSYMAVIGIVYFQPKIAKAIYIKNKYLKYLWNFFSVSLAAQITTLPFSLYYFHQFPNYFLITNLIAIPLSSLIIYTAVLCLALSIFPNIVFIPAFALKYLLMILNKTVQIVQNLPFAVSVSYINILQLTLLSVFIILISFYFEKKKFQLLFASLTILLVFFMSHTYTHITNLKRDEMVVFADNRNTAISIIKGNNQLVITNDSLLAAKTASNFWGLNKLNTPTYQTIKQSRIIDVQKIKIMILTDELIVQKQTATPIQPDILIIGNKVNQSCKQALACIHPQICIIDPTINYYNAEIIKNNCIKKGIACYNIREQGAYRFDFNNLILTD